MLRSRTVRPVGEADRAAALEVCARDPLSNCYVAARMDEVDLDRTPVLLGYYPGGRLESLNLRPRRLEIVSCPSCGRAQVDVYKLADEVTAGLEGMEVPLRVAVMGCVVNGPGEAREADLGVASGNGKGQIFVKGEVIKTVPESKIVETLIEEAMRLAEDMPAADGEAPTVSVS